jgi:hypothetical protein
MGKKKEDQEKEMGMRRKNQGLQEYVLDDDRVV